MPLRVDEYQAPPEIFRGSEGLRSSEHLTIDVNQMTLDREGLYPIAPGTWAMGPKGAARPLPASKLAASVVGTADQVLTVNSQTIGYFQTGDVLKVLSPMIQLELSGTYAVSDTITLTIDSIDYVYTAVDTSAADVALGLADWINENPEFVDEIEAIRDNEDVYVLSDKVSPVAIATSGSGVIGIADSLTAFTPNQEIGTIDSNGVNVTDFTLTLEAVSPIDLPEGMPVGVVGDVIGILARAIELTQSGYEHAVYTSGPIYAERMLLDTPLLKSKFQELDRG